jgi:FXSXX-COOH protein
VADDDGERRSDLIDISGLTLAQVSALPETALQASLKRIFEDMDSDVEPVAGFQSGII